MARGRGSWQAVEVLAFTERDGPGRPPGGSSLWSSGALAVVLGVTFVGLLTSDTLCPDHRLWVQALAGAAFVAQGGALVALCRGWAVAPLLTLAASSAGVSIGLLDAVHDPSRGRLVAAGFAVAALLSAVAGWRQHRLGRWDGGGVSLAVEASPPLSPALDAPPGPEASRTAQGENTPSATPSPGR